MSHIRDAQRDVEQFHRAMGQDVGERPVMPSPKVRELRARLIAEEVAETIAALGFNVDIQVRYPTTDGTVGKFVEAIYKNGRLDLAEVADGIADSIYVELGTAVSAGIDMEPVWEAVQMSNIAKASGPVRPDGKRLKPEGWEAPDVKGILQRQGGCDFGCCVPEETE
jgi:predicted HAD superfamily Cof-like phosphohydrolase